MIALLSQLSPRLAMLFTGLAIMGFSLFAPASHLPNPALGPAAAPATSDLSLETRVSALESKVASIHTAGDWTRVGTMIGAAIAGFSGVIHTDRRRLFRRPTPRRRSR